MTIIAGWNAALTGWTVADPTLPLTIAGGALIFMLLAWTIPNTAASVVGGAVSLNLSHAFEAAMAGYGLGRILTSQKPQELNRVPHRKVATRSAQASKPATKPPPTTALGRRQPSPRSRCPQASRGCFAHSRANQTAVAGRGSATQLYSG